MTKGILVVDDEATDIETARRILKGNRFRIWTAGDFDDAVKVFEANREQIHLALLDVALPGKNGVDLAKRLLDSNPELRVLFVSHHAGASVIRLYGLDASGDHFLQKPYDGATLLQRVQHALEVYEPLQLGQRVSGASGQA